MPVVHGLSIVWLDTYLGGVAGMLMSAPAQPDGLMISSRPVQIA